MNRVYSDFLLTLYNIQQVWQISSIVFEKSETITTKK